MNAKPVSESKPSGCGPVALGIFGSIFFLVGLGIFWVIFLVPLLEWNRARAWPVTEGTVTKSWIHENRDSDGSTYQAKFRYKYVVDGKDFESEKFNFFDFSGSRKGAKKQTAKHPVGSKTSVYYDPVSPASSVMNREIGWSALIGFVPLLFTVIGSVVLWGVIFKKWGSSNRSKIKSSPHASKSPIGNLALGLSSSTSSETEVHPDDLLDQEFDGPLKLKREVGRWVTLICTLGFCLFWNGFISMFIFGGGEKEWVSILFMIPFVLVGIGIFGFFIYTLLGMFNPQIEIAFSNGAIAPGEEVDVAWETIGNAGRIKNLTIKIEGVESATYRRGTSTYTDSETFKTIEIVATSDRDKIAFGSKTIQMSENAIHSCDFGNNSIKWKVEVHGVIPLWPDVFETYEFRVKPRLS